MQGLSNRIEQTRQRAAGGRSHGVHADEAEQGSGRVRVQPLTVDPLPAVGIEKAPEEPVGIVPGDAALQARQAQVCRQIAEIELRLACSHGVRVEQEHG